MPLATELSVDPLLRGYNGPGAANPGPGPMTDQQVTDDLHTLYRSRNRISMTGDEIFAATDAAQYDALTDADKLLWVSFCGRGTIDPFGVANVALVTSIFGAGTDTLTALASLRVESISRATELGLPVFVLSDIATDRS